MIHLFRNTNTRFNTWVYLCFHGLHQWSACVHWHTDSRMGSFWVFWEQRFKCSSMFGSQTTQYNPWPWHSQTQIHTHAMHAHPIIIFEDWQSILTFCITYIILLFYLHNFIHFFSKIYFAVILYFFKERERAQLLL